MCYDSELLNTILYFWGLDNDMYYKTGGIGGEGGEGGTGDMCIHPTPLIIK